MMRPFPLYDDLVGLFNAIANGCGGKGNQLVNSTWEKPNTSNPGAFGCHITRIQNENSSRIQGV